MRGGLARSMKIPAPGLLSTIRQEAQAVAEGVGAVVAQRPPALIRQRAVRVGGIVRGDVRDAARHVRTPGFGAGIARYRNKELQGPRHNLKRAFGGAAQGMQIARDRKSTRLNSS